ncbi:MAG: MlaE family lipid ABC transporter permease subunit [Deltaproteobacteria bacterium]|nr:MlaE family lipid ABC transporter permease subunit [Deltaproteobacteria bacterium]
MTPWQATREGNRIILVGELLIDDATAIWRTLQRLTRAPGKHLDLDLGHASAIDGAVLSLLAALRAQLIARGTSCELVGARDELRPLVHLQGADAAPPPRPPPRTPPPGGIARIGAGIERMAYETRDLIGFFGELVASSWQVVRRPRTVNWRSVGGHIERAAADGIPIVVLLDFLVGFVIAIQTMYVLELYGAEVFIADMVGISVTRELIPLMTAIIMSGRSGAAFAAELGTMRIDQEIDALRTMGISPMPYLVMPRVLALTIAAPLLTLLGDVVAILGGALVAVHGMELTSEMYFNELRLAVLFSDVWTGLVKSVGFGLTIAFIGCQQGLATSGSAEGVGRRTTSAVVACLFAIVLLDTAFTVVFRVVLG